MTERIVINPDAIYQAIRTLIPTLPPSEDVYDVHLTLTPRDGQLTLTTIDRPIRVTNFAQTEVSTTVTVYKIDMHGWADQ